MDLHTARYEREEAERELADASAPEAGADALGAEIARRMTAGDRSAWTFCIDDGLPVRYEEAVEQLASAFAGDETPD